MMKAKAAELSEADGAETVQMRQIEALKRRNVEQDEIGWNKAEQNEVRQMPDRQIDAGLTHEIFAIIMIALSILRI